MDISSIPMTELTSAGILVFLLQIAKKIPLIGSLGTWGHRVISILWALISTIIVSMEWAGNATHGGTLTIVLPGLGGGLIALWHWLNQFAAQEVIYQATAAHDSATAQEASTSASTWHPSAAGLPANPPGQH